MNEAAIKAMVAKATDGPQSQIALRLTTMLQKAGFVDPTLCYKCKGHIVEGEPDPCIGKLPGILNACCGHGTTRGYMQFENGTIVRFGDLCVDEVEEPKH